MEGEKTPTTRLLLCFIDDSETTLAGPFTCEALSALYLNSCPMLISASLLRNIIAHREYDPSLKTNYAKLTEASKNAHKGAEEGIVYDTLKLTQNSAALAILITQFDPEQWKWYKANDFLYLLVPSSQLREKPIEITKETLTPRELTLGLKVDHVDHLAEQSYDKIRDDLVKEKIFAATPTQRIQVYLKKYKRDNGNYFVDALYEGHIFVSRLEYRQAKALTQIPQWVIYVGGHGSIAGLIAYLKINQFQRLLDFMESKLLTRMAIINSCYASGTNTVLIYNDLRDPHLRKIYSFPIINLAFPDTSGGATFTKNAGFLIEENGKSIKPDLMQNYAELVSSLNEPKSLEYSTILKKISARSPESAFLRPQHRDFFFPLIPMLEIGTAFAQSRSKPLMIKDLVKQRRKSLQEPLNILLTVRNIPFTLNFTGVTGAVVFVSGIPGPETIHSFREIIINLPIKEFCKQLQFVQAVGKLFYIASLQIDSNSRVTYTDVVVTGGTTFAKKDGVAVQITRKFNEDLGQKECFEKTISREEEATYQSLLEGIKKPHTPEQTIQAKDIEHVKKLIKGGKSLPYPIFIKTIYGDDKELRDQISTIVFQQALRDKDFLLAREAMKYGADIFNQDILLQSPLSVAVKNGASDELLDELIRRGALKKTPVWHFANQLTLIAKIHSLRPV